MTLNSYKNNPDYPDRYTRNKEWKKILPIQGRPLQAAELTEIQSILQDNIKQGFDTLFKNGSPIEGLRLTVVSRTFDTVVINISEGQLYIEGTILNVLESNLTIPTNNIYNISVVINETIITEEDDNTLRDPIKGGFVLGTPGAARLIWSTSLAFNTPDIILNNSYVIGQVVNGVILQKDLNAFYEIEKVMSQFIYERSGNFCVNGLETTNLGIDKRSSSNVTKYNDLKAAVDNAEEVKQTSLANLVSYQGLVNNLTLQIQEAQIQASINSTVQNNNILSSLQTQLATAQNEFSKYSNELATSQKVLESASASLSKSENLLTDQQIVGVAPGIAYVEGFRVSINSPTKLYIPLSLPTTSVEAATFTFRGLISQSLRTFSLSSGATTEQTPSQYVSLEIDFLNLQVNPNVNPILPVRSFNIKVFYKINTNTALSTIIENIKNSLNGPTLINNDISYKIYDNDTAGTPELLEDALGDLLTQTIIKEILFKYIEVTSSSGNNLLFSATSVTLEAPDIIIDIRSKVYLKANDSLVSSLSNLIVNINSQALSLPISNSTYSLGFRPVQKINRLVANLTTTVTITRDENDSVDLLNEDSVVQIESVYQTVGNLTTVFSSANYYSTQSGIAWRNNASAIPANGTAYQVRFVYTEPLVENTDFILNNSTDAIEFIGRTPAINNTFTVDYSYSLAKGGIITLDKDGILTYLLSAPAKNPTIPSIPSNKLGIASFILNTNNIELKQLDCRRQTVSDLYNLAEKVKQNTLNNQILKADIFTLNSALASGSNPIGVFTDPIINLDKIDVKQTTAAIVPGIQAFMSGYTKKETEVNYIPLNTTATIVNNELNLPHYAILPYTEQKFFVQPRATQTREVNRIHRSINKRSKLFSNYKYIFINQESIETYPGTTTLKTKTKLSPCDPITRSGNFFSAVGDNSNLIKDIITNVRNILGPYGNSIIQSFINRQPFTIANTSNSSDFVSKAFNDFKTKSIQIELYAEDLPPGIKGFKVYINGAKWYNYILRGGTLSSIGTGTFADAQDGFTVKDDGTVELAITLPEELPTGVHTIEIKKEGHGYCKTNIYVYNALVNQLVLTPLRAWNAIPITTSTAEQSPLIPIDSFSEDLNLLGIDPTLDLSSIDNTVNFTPSIEKAFPTKYNTLNQTFVPTNDYFITKVGLKIKDAPTGNHNELKVFLTDTNQQIPIKQIRAATKSPTSYTLTNITSSNAGTYSYFNFNTPHYIKRNKKYGIGLEAYLQNNETSTFNIYTAIADETDINTNTIIGDQLFVDGDLFTSIDGSSLAIQSKEDLTLELWRAEFTNSATVNIGTFTTVGGINSFCYNTLDIIPIGTEIKYEYRIGTTGAWNSFTVNTVVCLSVDAASIEIKATLLSNFKTLSPLVLLKGSSVTMYNTTLNTTVISNKVIYPEPYRKITIVIDYIKPSNTDIEVYYSPNDGYSYQGLEWKELNIVPSSTIIIDSALQIYQTRYYLEEPTLTYINLDQRVKFRYKINLIASSNGISPLVKNIQTYVE